jgi:transposase
VEKHSSALNSIHRLLEKFNVVSVEELPELCRLQATCHLGQAEILQTQIKSLESALNDVLIPNAEIQRLLWVPGIGRINAFTVYLEVDGIERFGSVEQFHSYCRLVPGSNNSAGKQKLKRSKDGNRYLKLAFSHAAVRAIQYYGEVRSFYQSRLRKKNKPIARALVAKEIARITYHVLRTQQPYDGKFKGEVLERTKVRQWPRLASPAA